VLLGFAASDQVSFPIEVGLLGAADDAATAEHLRRLEERLRAER
jgi:hypothetical protein